MSLTVGFACTGLLVSSLVAESSADSFHTKKERIFELMSDSPFGGDGRFVYSLLETRDYLASNYPEVEDVCQLTNLDDSEIEVDGTPYNITLVEADASFFDLFDFPLESGTRASLTPDGMIISSQKARQLFGSTDVLGRTVVIKRPEGAKTLVITGVLGKTKEKSHLSFEALVGKEAFKPTDPEARQGGVTYLLLHDALHANGLLSKVNSDSLRPTLTGPGKVDYYLEPLEASYFSASNKMPFMRTRSETFIWVGWIVCGLILFMAGFNFINLFLLSMQERKKEQGIKKTLGISLSQAIGSLTLETSLYIALSFLISMLFVYILMPVFNSVLATDLTFSYMSKFKVMAVIGLIVFALGFIAVIISVFQQRRVLPVSMMKNSSSKVRFSKLFFTLQFFVSITLCVCSITIIRQMEFLENEPVGFNRNILQVKSPSNDGSGNLVEFKNQVLQIPGIDHASLSSGNPISRNMIAVYELEDGKRFTPYLFAGDEDFMATLDLKLVDGNIDIRSNGGKLVNETLVKQFDMKDPIGMTIPGTTDRITGVVKDFVCSSFKQAIPPVIISHKPDANELLIDYSHTTLAIALPKIRDEWNKTFHGEMFDYRVIQEDLMKKYSEETLFLKIVVASSITSIVISCFGLFALSWAVIRSRAKEMSIRKVLGAGVTDILALLTTSFAKRLALAFALAAPAGYYLTDLWLSRFVYKVTVNGWIFLIAAAVLATITVVTLGLQTVRASTSSPLNDIRD